MSLDCFKCLNVILYQKIESFERQTRKVDLTVIDNGVFYPNYTRKKVDAARMVEKAKLAEASDISQSLKFYQNSYNIYTEIVDLITTVSEKVKWARVRFTLRCWLTWIGWIVSIIVSAVISATFSCEIISSLLEKSAQ